MNNLNKLFVTICFSVLVSTAILAVDTSQDVWASNETSYQIKSNAGITFIEGDTSITDNSNGKNNSQSNNIKSDTKKVYFHLLENDRPSSLVL